jgi:hypothetical protein
LLAFGILGIGRACGLAASNFDMRYYYLAGQMWLHGQTPYDGPAFAKLALERFDLKAGAFAYPPQIAPLALALGALPFRAAQVLMTALNLGSLAALTALALRMTPHAQAAGMSRKTATITIILLAILIGNPFATHVVWMGQTSLFAAAAALGAWYMTRQNRNTLAGVLLGLSTIKPQLVVLLVFWFLLNRRWHILAVGALTAFLCALWPTLITGFEATWLQWFTSLSAYQSNTVAATGFQHVFGLRSALIGMGLEPRNLAPLVLLAPLSVGALYLARRRLDEDAPASLLFALSALLLYSHDYDLAACVVIVVPLAARTQDRRILQIAVLSLLGVLFFPQRFWQRFDLATIARTREIALLALSLVHLALAQRKTQ